MRILLLMAVCCVVMKRAPVPVLADFPACPAEWRKSSLTEEADRADFDDVDDYHCFRASGASLSDVPGQSMADSYSGYQLAVETQLCRY